MNKILLASLLAVGSALAQTGEYGRAMEMGMGQGYGFHQIILCALFIGITVAVWLYAYKLFKEIRKMK